MKNIFPTNNYVVFDFETTGLDWNEHEVIQMSALKRKNGEWDSPFNLFIKIDTQLPQMIVDLTHIDDQMLLEKGILASVAWSEFYAYIENLPLIGHNIINFDTKFLELACQKFNLPLPSPKRYIDTAMLYKAKKLNQSPFWHESHYDFALRVSAIRALGVRYKLTICCEELGIDMSQLTAHRSDSDIIMTNALYERFLQEL